MIKGSAVFYLLTKTFIKHLLFSGKNFFHLSLCVYFGHKVTFTYTYFLVLASLFVASKRLENQRVMAEMKALITLFFYLVTLSIELEEISFPFSFHRMPEEEREGEEDAKVFCPGLTKAVLNQIKKQQKKSLNMDMNHEAMKVKS